MAGIRDGIVWKVQLAIFVFVAVSATRRLFEGSFTLDTLSGAGNVGLLLVAVAGALAVATTREPVSALFAPDGPDDDTAEEP